jgi:N-acyl-D-aspartate/D-glutamate deacylase
LDAIHTEHLVDGTTCAPECKTQFRRTLGVVLDLLITGGTIVDGTGARPRTGDLGVRDGRIVAVGEVDEPATRTLDADGLVVAPGVIDLHTHYDAQVLWDGAASPSPLHGVTTVVGGNCGFSLAPLGDGTGDVDYVRSMMSVVEGIPMDALELGATWDWRTFADYLGRLDGHVVVNAGFLAGHSTIRRAAMGAAATEGEATPDQIREMERLLGESLHEGALGFSSGWDNAHYDRDGKAVPSRTASAEEFLALARVVGKHAGTTIGMFPWMGELPGDRMELMADMSVAADRPVNWNLLGSMSPVEIYEQQLAACDLARERGGRVVALALPDFLRMRASTLLATIPEFEEVLRAPDAERRVAVQDPDVRARLTAAIERASQTEFAAVGRWDLLEIAEPRGPETEPLVGLTIEQAAAQLGKTPIEVLLDVVVPEELPLTVMLPTLVPSLGASDAGWRARAAIWGDSRVMLGGSDAGAHLDLMCHANYPTMVLGDSVRERHLLPLEEAVRLMTEAPARLLGLRDRGHIVEGAHADLMVFDPDAVGSGPAIARHDLPGGGERLYAESIGVEHVFVNGAEIVTRGELTGVAPGTALRSGRDTDTVTVRERP